MTAKSIQHNAYSRHAIICVKKVKNQSRKVSPGINIKYQGYREANTTGCILSLARDQSRGMTIK